MSYAVVRRIPRFTGLVGLGAAHPFDPPELAGQTYYDDRPCLKYSTRLDTWQYRGSYPPNPLSLADRRCRIANYDPATRQTIYCCAPDEGWPWRIDQMEGPARADTIFGTSQPTLRQNATGSLVGLVQRFLGIPENQNFDANTAAAVRQFQASRGLVADSIVGPNTWAAFDAATLAERAQASGDVTATMAFEQWAILRADPSQGGAPPDAAAVMAAEQAAILAADPSQAMSEEAKANYLKGMYASLPAPVQAAPPDAATVMAAEQAAILAADPSQGMSEEAKANYVAAMYASLPAPVGPAPTPAPMQANTPVPITPAPPAAAQAFAPAPGPMLTRSALPAGAKSLVQTGGLKTWWAAQSTGTKAVVVGGGAVAVLGVLSLMGGSASATPNRRRKGR
jgi:peptidoglycan hydrolase-like protein with peptidoglycan-binding domain